MARTTEFWFRRKYNLPPTDPRYLNMTVEGMLAEYWAHTYYDDPERDTREVADDDFDENALIEEFSSEAELSNNPDDWEEIR